MRLTLKNALILAGPMIFSTPVYSSINMTLYKNGDSCKIPYTSIQVLNTTTYSRTNVKSDGTVQLTDDQKGKDIILLGQDRNGNGAVSLFLKAQNGGRILVSKCGWCDNPPCPSKEKHVKPGH